MKTSAQGRAMIESFEGLRTHAYLDSIGRPTIGFGHTGNVRPGDVCTRAQADQWLSEDLTAPERAVNLLVKVPLSQPQFDALVSLAYNIGSGNFARAIAILRPLNAGNYIAAAAQFTQYDTAGGLVSPGLFNRRTHERDVFIHGYQQVA